MANIFNSVSAKIPKRHKFKLNHQSKLTGEMGELLPIFCQDVLPSDRFRISTQQLIRFAPLTAPVMSDIDCYVHFFFVPNRLIWKDWETFITGSKNGKKLSEDELPSQPKLVIPHSYIGKTAKQANQVEKFSDGKQFVTNGTLLDYLQFPTVPKNYVPSKMTDDYEVDELPLRAYQRIFFDWYRDENLSEFDDFEIIDNEDFNNGKNYFTNSGINGDKVCSRANLLLKLQHRAWKKDYFTSALPFAQKGDDVLIPGGSGLSSITGTGSIPINIGNADGAFQTVTNVGSSDYRNVQFRSRNETGLNTGRSGSLSVQYGPNDEHVNLNLVLSGADGSGNINISDIANGLSLDGISQGTIRELRRAMAAQRFLEREAVGGTRYIEQILSFFGVKSSDARLQRSEFLGGSKQPVVISQVLQTSETTQGSPLGQPAGNAVSAGGKYIFDRTFEEHGWIIGLMSIIPRAEYMNGYPKKYMKNDRFDYYWPQFAHIGEQEIKRSELNYDFFNGVTNVNNDTFGYTPRYAEYRFINSHVHGDFKDTLEFWTLVRDYGEEVPKLNEEFITCRPSTRIFAYEREDDNDANHLWIQVGFNIDALRPLPKYGESI